jgi:hypothetical protein
MPFSALPPVPQADNKEWQFRFNNAVKQNMELLTGQRGSASDAALLKGQLTVNPVAEMNMRQVTATGLGIAVNSAATTAVAVQSDYVKLLVDVQTLANDVANIRATLNSLIEQLKGSS